MTAAAPGATTPTEESSALEELIALLDLEEIEVDLYRGTQPRTDRQRVFGGQVAGQALVAAGRTVDPLRGVHSLHSYFLRPGDPGVPIIYRVDRLRDGRGFSTRRVAATQHGRAIFALTASFCLSEPGFEHQDRMPEVPPASTLQSLEGRLADVGRPAGRPASLQAIDLRYVGDPPLVAARDPSPHAARSQVWFRAAGQLPEDPLLHVCVLTYASDMTLLDSVILPHHLTYDGAGVQMMASLDHAMWFHRPFRADEWLLYDQESPSAAGGRGIARGRIFGADGRLVCTLVQEGLVRVLDPPDAGTAPGGRVGRDQGAAGLRP